MRITIALSTLATGVALAAATAAGAATPPTINEIGFANLALHQMLTLSPTNAATTAWADQSAAQLWDQIYRPELPTEPGMSSPYQLRAHGTHLCLQDVGEGRSVIAVECEANPVEGSTQLWQHHRITDRLVGDRNYYFRFNRATDRVMTAFPASENPDSTRVISMPAEPVSKGGAADLQLWTMLVP